jgi:Mg/Co/Ni transporter MgtE
MPPDDRTRLLEEMPAEVTRRLLATLSPEDLKNTRWLLGYPDETAGRYMTPNFTEYGRHFMPVAFTVWAALIGVVTFGTLAGSMLPFVLRRLEFDPPAPRHSST